MARIIYSDRQIDEFITVANEIGISPALRQLKYPQSYATAVSWFDLRGVGKPDIDSLLQRANEMKRFYGDSEKKLAIQTLIDRIVEKLNEDDLDADGLNKLSNALNKAMQTLNLIDGKSTAITESHTKGADDLAIMDMISAAKAKNNLKEQELNEAK